MAQVSGVRDDRIILVGKTARVRIPPLSLFFDSLATDQASITYIIQNVT